MSYVTIDASRGIATVRLEGDVSLAVVEAALLELIGHEAFAPGTPAVWDFRDADAITMDVADFGRLTVFNRGKSDARGVARVALVSSKDAVYGTTRMFEVIGAVPNLEFKAFRDMESGTSWVLDRVSDETQGSVRLTPHRE